MLGIFSLVGQNWTFECRQGKVGSTSVTVVAHVALLRSGFGVVMTAASLTVKTTIGNDAGVLVQLFCIWGFANIALYTYGIQGKNAFWNFCKAPGFISLRSKHRFRVHCAAKGDVREQCCCCLQLHPWKTCTAELPAVKNWQRWGERGYCLPWQGHEHCLTVPPSDVYHNSTGEQGTRCLCGKGGRLRGPSPVDTEH